jgi:hypothetical protein
MRHVRRAGWAGLGLFGAAGIVGLVTVIVSALVAGDWDLAPMPWIGIGMQLTVIGLAGVAWCSLLLDILEPIGAWRLLAIPPALIVGAFWIVTLTFGVPGHGGPYTDPATILYTLPLVLAVLVVCTAALALPAVVGRRVAAR